ncbi:hypothetical protein WDW89_07835 [Deltaproteobacteria bacterium TL4]
MEDFRRMFSKEEWLVMQFATLWVFELVAKADGRIDQKERNKLYDILRHPFEYNDTLVEKFLRSLYIHLDELFPQFQADSRDPLDGIKEALQIVKAHAPEHSKMFRIYLYVIGYKIAEASKGFLGLEARVSRSEKAALAQLAKLFAFSPEELELAHSIA